MKTVRHLTVLGLHDTDPWFLCLLLTLVTETYFMGIWQKNGRFDDMVLGRCPEAIAFEEVCLTHSRKWKSDCFIETAYFLFFAYLISHHW